MLMSNSAMWLLTFVFAFVASIYACEEPCECLRNTTQLWNISENITDIECLDKLTIQIGELLTCECHSISRNTSNIIREVECFDGVPLLETLPKSVKKLIVQSADEYEVINILTELENSSLSCLQELTITNSSFIQSNFTWPPLLRITVLNISQNNLVDLNNLKLNNQSGLIVLDLSENQLSGLPGGKFRTLINLLHLSLRNNVIKNVDEEAFVGLVRLEHLDMSDNKLVLLPDDTLTHLSSLQTLNLSGNQLKILGARWFEALGQLRELDVSRNGLTKAASDVLQPLPGLSVLRLAENPLMEKDVSLLLGTGRRLETVDASRTGLDRVPAALTRSVRALRLAGNKLTCIRDGDFDGYPLLKILDLSDNLLNDVEEDSLGRLETLEELDLSGNKLKIIPKSLPESLLILNLQGNNLVKICSTDLEGIENLQKLFMDHNNIENIEDDTFTKLSSLKMLDISYNPIKQLQANVLAGPTNLATLYMSHLTSLEWEYESRGDMTFPVPMPEMLVTLDISHSPILAAQLLADNAALSACKSLTKLNLINTNLTTIRSDLIFLLPQLQILGLSDNTWNCSYDILWLGEWLKEHDEIQPPARCNFTNKNYNLTDVLLIDLPTPLTTSSISLTTIHSRLTNQSNHTKNENVMNLNIQVPNASSNAGIINNSINSINNIHNNITIVKIINTTANIVELDNEISIANLQRQNKSNIANSNDNKLTKISTSSPVSVEGLHDTRQNVKSRKKVQSLRDNERLRSDSKSLRDKIIRSQKANEQEKLINSKLHQSSKYILKNRVNSADQTLDNANHFQRSTINNDVESEVSNKIVSDLMQVDSMPDSKSQNDLDKMKKFNNNLVFANNIADTLAEELNGHATETHSKSIAGISTHPGMLILTGAIIGAAAALTVVLSRRATVMRRDKYHRHENIEVHTLTPTTELW